MLKKEFIENRVFNYIPGTFRYNLKTGVGVKHNSLGHTHQQTNNRIPLSCLSASHFNFVNLFWIICSHVEYKIEYIHVPIFCYVLIFLIYWEGVNAKHES